MNNEKSGEVTGEGEASRVTDWKRLALSSINRNQTVHQFLRNVGSLEKPLAFEAWISAVKEIQRKATLPNVELFDDPQH